MHDDYNSSNIKTNTEQALGKGIGLQTKFDNYSLNLASICSEYYGAYQLCFK